MTTVHTPQSNDAAASPTLDVAAVRQDFPILHELVRGKPYAYLDNAASAQKPQCVLDRITEYYTKENANIHRGIHYLSEVATNAYEDARAGIQRHLHASGTEEIIFVRGTTEAINLVAQTYGRKEVGAGDEIIVSHLEHHSNIVPWQMLCEEKGATLRVIPMTDDGDLVLEEYHKLLGPRTKIVAVSYVSNALGTVNPVEEIIAAAHSADVPVLLDAAQAVPHLPVDVKALDCDFLAFSGHKAFGPTGVGILYAKEALLEAMPPYQGGGDMISSVTFEKTEYNRLPYKFEAGTPNIAGGIGLGVALDYLEQLGWDKIRAYEADLLEYGTRALEAVPGVRLVGTAKKKESVLSFLIDGVHPHDAGMVLDQAGLAVRTGHHCAQPIMDRLGIPATVRASLAFYNTREEIDALVAGIGKVQAMFSSTNLT